MPGLISSSILFKDSQGNSLISLDPTAIAESFDPSEGDTSIPFLNKANGFKLPRGKNPGVGYVLLKRSDVDTLDLNATNHELTFIVGGINKTLSKLCITSALTITGTANSSAQDVYLVELQDTRCLAPLYAIDKSYNVPSIDFTEGTAVEYYAATTNSGTPWTWTTMLQDIFGLMPILGSLSLTNAALPGEKPENYCFRGMRAWDAFCQAVEDSGNYIICKATGDYELVANGFADTTNRTAINNAVLVSFQGLNPSWPRFGTGMRLPEKYRVFFPKKDYNFQNTTDPLEIAFTEWWRNAPLYHVDVTSASLSGTASAVTIAGTIGVIHSSRGAFYKIDGTLLNSSDLDTEATLLAQHEANRALGEVRRHDIFHGIVDVGTGVAAAAVAWYDYGQGIRTELYTSPEETPPIGGSGSGAEDCPTDSLSIAAKDAVGPPDISRWDLPFERFAVCKLQGDLSANSRVQAYVEYGDVPGAADKIVWANTTLPLSIYVYEAFGNTYKQDDVVYCAFHSQVHRWIVLTTKGKDVVLFQLTATLDNGGSADAVILKWDGAAYVEGDPIIVHDWYPETPVASRGMWQGETDHMGIAVRRDKSTTDYDIIWMQTYAWSLEGHTTAALGGSSSGGAAAATDAAFEQGISPGSTFTLHDDQNFFPRSQTGAQVKGVRSEYMGSQKYYKAANAQQMSFYGIATLGADMCGSSATVSGFTKWMFSPFNQDPPALPSTAQNPFGLAGFSGDSVLLLWAEPLNAWVVAQVTHHIVTVITGLRIQGDYIQGFFTNIYVMKCDTGSWIDVIPLTSCPSGSGS